MINARGALAFALLLALISAQQVEDEVSKSIESADISDEQHAAEEEAESSTATIEPTTTKRFKGFVTPRPFVSEDPLFSSKWAAWSAWSFCVNNVKIRVRACNTVRGFSCVGRNQETQPCAVSLYHHTPKPATSDFDVVDDYEEDRNEALKQLYPDENPSEVLERRRPNPNFLRIGTTPSAAATAEATTPRAQPERPSEEPEENEAVRSSSSVERLDEKEEKENTEKEQQAGQQPDADFKAKGAKTETQSIPLQSEIDGALERLEVHRHSETRRQHSSNYHRIGEQKAAYAHDGSMGTGYTLVQNKAAPAGAITADDLLEEDAPSKAPAAQAMHDADRAMEGSAPNRKAKIQKSKFELAKISALLDYEIEELEKKVSAKHGKGSPSGLHAIFHSRGEQAPGSVDTAPIDPRHSKFAGAYVGKTKSPSTKTTVIPGRGAEYVEYSDYAEYDEHGKLITMTPKPKTNATTKTAVKTRSAIYDTVLDTDTATYDQYEEWIGDKGSKEIINRRVNKKKGGQHDSLVSIPVQAKARTTVQPTVQLQQQLQASHVIAATTAAPVQKQGKINFDHSAFLKEILVSDFADYEDVTHKKNKLDGEASISPSSPSVPVFSSSATTSKPKVTPSRRDQMNKVSQLEDLLGLPHQGLLDETLHPQTNPVVWATPTPQFRSEGGGGRRGVTRPANKKKTKKIIHKQAKPVNTVDIENVDVFTPPAMVDSDAHTFDGDAGVEATTHRPAKKVLRKKVLKTKQREQPALLDNDDFSSIKGFSAYPPGTRSPPFRGTTRGVTKQKALSFGITGRRHRTIHDLKRAREIIASRKRLFRKKFMNAHRYASTVAVPINDDTVKALDWMMHSLGATDLLEQPLARKTGKYQHARINSKARAEIGGAQQRPQFARRGGRIDSVAIGSPNQKKVIHRPAKILRHKQIPLVADSHIHDSDLVVRERVGGAEGVSRRRPYQKLSSAPGVSKQYHGLASTPLPDLPPDLRPVVAPPQKSLPAAFEQQPLEVLPPPLDEASDQARYPRNGQFGGFELDGSSPDAASYLASEATARPGKILPRRSENSRARGVKTASSVGRKEQIEGVYTSYSGDVLYPRKLMNEKPRQPVAGLPEQYLRSGPALVDSDGPEKLSDSKTTQEKKAAPVPFVMHDASSADGRNTIAAEIERLEQLVNENKEKFNAPTLSGDSSSTLDAAEFAPLLNDPRLYEDALKEIREENAVLGLSGSDLEQLALASGADLEDSEARTTADPSGRKKGSQARWSAWGEWGVCLCGQQLRTRACESPDGIQVNGCKGSSYEAQSCQGGSCPAAAAA